MDSKTCYFAVRDTTIGPMCRINNNKSQQEIRSSSSSEYNKYSDSTDSGNCCESNNEFPTYLLCLIPKSISIEFIKEAWTHYKGDKEKLIFCCRDISSDSEKIFMMNNTSLWKYLLRDEPVPGIERLATTRNLIGKEMVPKSSQKATDDCEDISTRPVIIDEKPGTISTKLQPYFTTLSEFLGGLNGVKKFSDWFNSLEDSLSPCLINMNGLEAIISIYLDVKDKTVDHQMDIEDLLSLDVFVVDIKTEEVKQNDYSAMAYRRSLLGIVSKETCAYLNKNYNEVFNDLKTLARELGIDTTIYSHDMALLLYEAYSAKYDQIEDGYTNPFRDVHKEVPKFPERLPPNTSSQDVFNIAMDYDVEEPLIQWRGGGAWPPTISNGMYPPRAISILPACAFKHRVLKGPDFGVVQSNFALIQACRGNKNNSQIEISARKVIAEEFAKVLRSDNDTTFANNILPPYNKYGHVKGHKHCSSLSIDLHYCSREVCRSVVLGWLDYIRSDNNGTFQIHFVTGQSRGSYRSIPVLIETVLMEINGLCRSDRDHEWGWNRDHPGVIVLQNRRKRIHHINQLENAKLPKPKRRGKRK